MNAQFYRGSRRHLRLAREASWCSLPEVPDWTCVPLWEGRAALGASQSFFVPDTRYGGIERSVMLPDLQQAGGVFETLAWPELTGPLLDAALERVDDPADPRSGDLHSYTLDVYTPVESRRISGAMVERLELDARPDALRARASVRGRAETALPGLTEDAFSYADLSAGPFRLTGASVTLDEGAVSDLNSFLLVVDNDVRAVGNQAGRVAHMAARTRSVDLIVRRADISDALALALREGAAVSLDADFAHPAGHSLSIRLPALHPAELVRQAAPQRVASSNIVLHATTDQAGSDLTYQITLV